MSALRFREDGTFTIVQFTDLHWKNGDEKDLQTRSLMELVLKEEAPDLIVFTGDLIYSENCEDPKQSLREVVRTAEESGIPWAAVFGNHDSEVTVTRSELLDALLTSKNGLSGHTPNVSGYGNYALTVGDNDGKAAAALYFLDSGDYSDLPNVDGYAWIKRDQIEWYEAESQRLEKMNGGTPLPSLAFFHIPLREYADVWERQPCFGHKHENVCSSQINSGFFEAMVKRGDVVGTFVGHDHINDYWGELFGIRLCYGRASGYNTYGKEGFNHGARVIRLTKGERQFESWLRLDDGSIDRQTSGNQERKGD